MRKKALVGLVVIAALAAFAPVGTASAATHSVQVTYKFSKRTKGTTKGTFSGSPFGKGTIVSKETANRGTYILTLSTKAGSATFVLIGGPAGGTKIVGVWHFTKGTGKYKGITGKGKMTGSQAPGGSFTLKGSAKY